MWCTLLFHVCSYWKLRLSQWQQCLFLFRFGKRTRRWKNGLASCWSIRWFSRLSYAQQLSWWQGFCSQIMDAETISRKVYNWREANLQLSIITGQEDNWKHLRHNGGKAEDSGSTYLNQCRYCWENYTENCLFA